MARRDLTRPPDSSCDGESTLLRRRCPALGHSREVDSHCLWTELKALLERIQQQPSLVSMTNRKPCAHWQDAKIACNRVYYLQQATTPGFLAPRRFPAKPVSPMLAAGKSI
jgi:hypothetical protein